MRQAIETRFVGPTDTRGARVRARAQAGSTTVPWDHGLSVPCNHSRAAEALARKLGWEGAWCGGAAASGNGYVFVLRSVPEFTVEMLYCAACQAATQYDCQCEAP